MSNDSSGELLSIMSWPEIEPLEVNSRWRRPALLPALEVRLPTNRTLSISASSGILSRSKITTGARRSPMQ